MKLVELLASNAASRPQAIAAESGEISVSYREMLAEVQTLSEQLELAGCAAGVKVAIVLDNSVEYLISFFAISAAKGTILPLSAQMTPDEIAKYVDRADVSIIVTSKARAGRRIGQLGCPNKITVICVRYSATNNLEVEARILGECKVDAENGDIALMVPTSGTTGLSKIVMLTDNQLLSNMIAYRSVMGFKKHYTVFCGLPMHHIYCISAQVLTHISLGDTLVISRGPFFVKDFLKSVETHKVNITSFVPYMAILLAQFPQPSMFGLSSLRYITLAGGKTPRYVHKILTEKFGHIEFVNTYGLTEASPRVSIAGPLTSRYPFGSAGEAMPSVSVRIVGDEGNSFPPNCVGEILVKSPSIMKGYYRQPALTATTVVDGWLRTGDLGRLDQDGNLFIVGRTKDIIMTGGKKVCPLEIEECLVEHPTILEAAVVAQADRLLQEVPLAFVVKRQSNNLTLGDIIKFCRNRLSSYKVPRSVKFMGRLPKLGNSKIDRRLLKKIAKRLA